MSEPRKQCVICGRRRGVSKFRFRLDTDNWRPECRECEAADARERRAQKKAA